MKPAFYVQSKKESTSQLSTHAGSDPLWITVVLKPIPVEQSKNPDYIFRFNEDDGPIVMTLPPDQASKYPLGKKFVLTPLEE